MPSNPYSIPTIGFESLIPFNKEQLAIISHKKIHSVYESGTNPKTYYFSNGLLDSSISTLNPFIKIERRYRQVTTYKYDSNKNLVLKKTTDNFDYYLGYDSLAYDNQNRITRYYAYSLYKKNVNRRKSKNYLTIHSDLFYIKSIGNLFLLADSTHKSFPINYYLDSKNSIMKRVLPNRIDSLKIMAIAKDTLMKTWYIKLSNDSNFHLGSNIELLNQKIIEQVNYSIYDTKHVTKNKYFKYNSKNQLIQIYDNRQRYTEKFYTYNIYGLIHEIITRVNRKPKSYRSFTYN